MPYIAIKAYPRDDETKQELTRRINEAVLETLGCPKDAVCISIEDVSPDVWEETVEKPLIEPNMDKMMLYWGEPTDKMK